MWWTFSHKAIQILFTAVSNNMGYSFAANLKGGGLGFQAEAGFSKEYEKESEKKSESHTYKHFESRVMYSVVPTAACELKTHSLKLSREALLELQNIEKLIEGSHDTEYVGNTCETFFSKYGSHINAGILHFGGVNKFIATLH